MLLYRFITFEQFVDIVVRQRMYLTQMLRWDDPYEARPLRELVNEILDTRVDENVPRRVKDEIIAYVYRGLYAQSWTMLDESDALWRIYSPDKMGVRITVDSQDVLDSIGNADFTKPGRVNILARNVEYCSPQVALDKARQAAQVDGKYRFDPASLCFFKREQFSHEQEYRFCVGLGYPGFELDLTQTDFTQAEEENRIVTTLQGLTFPSIQYYPIEPKAVRAVTLDPRAPTWFLETAQHFCSKYLPNAQVNKSQLYESPSM